MNFFSKLVVIILLILSIMYVKDKFVPDEDAEFSFKNKFEQSSVDLPKDSELQEPTAEEEEETTQKIQKEYVSIYFTNANSGGVKKVIRELPNGEQKLTFAIKELINGPIFKERNQGFSSEIPKGTKILKIKDQGSLIVIDLSDEFQYGGGTESQYARLNQLIKTVLALKLDKPVYLYINGQKAEVIGGEGIIITQPLSENSLNG